MRTSGLRSKFFIVVTWHYLLTLATAVKIFCLLFAMMPSEIKKDRCFMMMNVGLGPFDCMALGFSMSQRFFLLLAVFAFYLGSG